MKKLLMLLIIGLSFYGCSDDDTGETKEELIERLDNEMLPLSERIFLKYEITDEYGKSHIESDYQMKNESGYYYDYLIVTIGLSSYNVRMEDNKKYLQYGYGKLFPIIENDVVGITYINERGEKCKLEKKEYINTFGKERLVMFYSEQDEYGNRIYAFAKGLGLILVQRYDNEEEEIFKELELLEFRVD